MSTSLNINAAQQGISLCKIALLVRMALFRWGLYQRLTVWTASHHRNELSLWWFSVH